MGVSSFAKRIGGLLGIRKASTGDVFDEAELELFDRVRPADESDLLVARRLDDDSGDGEQVSNASGPVSVSVDAERASPEAEPSSDDASQADDAFGLMPSSSARARGDIAIFPREDLGRDGPIEAGESAQALPGDVLIERALDVDAGSTEPDQEASHHGEAVERPGRAADGAFAEDLADLADDPEELDEDLWDDLPEEAEHLDVPSSSQEADGEGWSWPVEPEDDAPDDALDDDLPDFDDDYWPEELEPEELPTEPLVEDWRADRLAISLAAALPFDTLGAAHDALPAIRDLMTRFPHSSSVLGMRRLATRGVDLERLLQVAEIKSAWAEDETLWLNRRRGWGGGWIAEPTRIHRNALSWIAAESLLADRSPGQAIDLMCGEWREDWLALGAGGPPDRGPGSSAFWSYAAWLGQTEERRLSEDAVWSFAEGPPHVRRNYRTPDGGALEGVTRIWGDAIAGRVPLAAPASIAEKADAE